MRRLRIAALVLLALTANAWAAGTVTVVEETYGTVKKIKWAWTTTAGGAADLVTAEAYSGKVEALVTVPGGGGAAPTDNYDVTVTDEDGTDVLAGGGVDRDTANTETKLSANLGIVANDKLTLNVTNAGAAKSGVVYLYIR